MRPTPEIEAFIARVNALPDGPGVSLDSVLQPSLDEETELRKLFATDKKNPALANHYVGLVDVFDAPDTIRTTRARVVEGQEDRIAKYVLPLSAESRRHEGEPSVVDDLEEFKRNWNIFTEGSLSQLFDWNNIVAAGGSVLACLTPLDKADKTSKRAIRKYYHTDAYPTSDVDLFLWGLTPEQADLKIKTICEAVRDSVPWDVTCIRTKHTVSIHSQYPYRSVQIILRLYQSPAEILAGFDIDAPCCAYDGNRVWANPRAIVAMMRQCNTVNMTRRSPSYEVRLAKYSQRSFEIYVPTLDRSKIDSTIFDRCIVRTQGLARLLALEIFSDDNMRNAFWEARHQLRGRLYDDSLFQQKSHKSPKRKGDFKAEKDMFALEMNDYDVASLHIPYGPGWDARRIEKLVYQTDFWMNSTSNPKNKGRCLHRHPAFFGTIEECLEDCCGSCPKPVDDDEKALQAQEDEIYIRGRIRYIEENPGRQTISGSFKPIDVGDWSEQAYIKPTQALFNAIAAHDRIAVQRLLGEEGINVKHRDHVGRTTLHIAIISEATDIALDLLDAGARITARMADGRNPLHLAAQLDQLAVVQKLLERNYQNIKEAEEKNPTQKDKDSMDSHEPVVRLSYDDEDVEMVDVDNEEEESNDQGGKISTSKKQEVNEDAEDEDRPDIINVNESDWDFGFTALSYAILFGSVPTIDALLAGGADVKLQSKPSSGRLPSLHPLTLTILRDDEDEGCKIAEHLLNNGATSATVNANMRTIFHAAVYAGRMKLVETLIRCDPHSAGVINVPMQNAVFPIVTAISMKHYGIVALLLAYGAKLDLDEKDIARARDAAKPDTLWQPTTHGEVSNYLQLAYQPLEVALKNKDDLTKLLIHFGASVNFGIWKSLTSNSDARNRRTVKEWVDCAIASLERQVLEKQQEELVVVDIPMSEPVTEEINDSWKTFYSNYSRGIRTSVNSDAAAAAKRQESRRRKETIEGLEDLKDFFVEIQTLLQGKGAKGWKDVYPDVETQAINDKPTPSRQSLRAAKVALTNARLSVGVSDYYVYLSATDTYDRQHVPQRLVGAYNELYEACYAGDNDRILYLCLPIEDQDSSGRTSLNISVKLIDSFASRDDQNGYTPLFAATAGRRWSTARLILAIATAQYHPSDNNAGMKFSFDVNLGTKNVATDDFGNESRHFEKSNLNEVNYLDIATRLSTVQCEVHPRVMLTEATTRWFKKKNASESWSQSVSLHLLAKAVADHDLDAFVHISDLYQRLAESIELGEAILDDIIRHDQVEILDSYIRKTGGGVNIDIANEDVWPTFDIEKDSMFAPNDANKMYLGLDVHGKKRMDLESKNDPNASLPTNDERKRTPILWQAVRANAKNIIKYLASYKPIEAYQAYSTSVAHGDLKASWLRRAIFGEKGKETSKAEAQKKLLLFLGWQINSVGESPLIAALIASNVDVDTIELLTTLDPKLMAQALETKIKFVGVNVLHFAVLKLLTIKVLDYLLARRVSPAERDNRGWNVFHTICNTNNSYLLEFFLDKLPKELTEELLKQQSKVRFNTPLHVAVKRGHLETTNIILRHSPSLSCALLQMRDVDGQTPLHAASRRTSFGIAKSILDVSKSLSSPSLPLLNNVLYTEDCVGLTPLKVIRLSAFSYVMSKHVNSEDMWYSSPSTLTVRPEPQLEPRRVTISDGILEKGLLDLKELLTRWEGDGKDVRGRVDMGLLRLWVAEMEKRLEREKELQRKREEEEEAEKEEEKKRHPKSVLEGILATNHPVGEPFDVEATHKLLEEANASLSHSGTQMHRILIHPLDVQRSVQASVANASSSNKGNEDQLEAGGKIGHRTRQEQGGSVGEFKAKDEEEERKKERRMSTVFEYLDALGGPDIL